MQKDKIPIARSSRDFYALSHLNRRKILRNTNQPIPRFLYKYRSIDPDDENSVDKIRDILVRSFLWFSSPKKFNDPFDMSAYIYFEGSIRDKQNKAKRIAKTKHLKGKMRSNFIKQFMMYSDDEIMEYTIKSYSSQLDNMGVFSFAADPRSILMWSHYSTNHRGICIQFDIAQDFDLIRNALEVSYSPDYPKLNYIDSDPKKLQRILLHKHEGWSYEKEHRMLHVDNADKQHRVNPSVIRSIIFGCKTPDTTIDVINALLEERYESKKPPVKLYRAVQHKTKYALRIYKHI